MYDYKFRENDLSFSEPKKPTRYRPKRKRLLLGAGILVAAGGLYGILHLGLIRQDGSETLETGSENIIPLPLPPYTEPQEPAPTTGSDG